MGVQRFAAFPAFVAALFLSPNLFATTPWRIHIDTDGAGAVDSSVVPAFEKAVADAGCPLKVVEQDREGAELAFSARPGNLPGKTVWFYSRSWNNLPLTSAVVVRASTGVSSLQNLSGMAVGISSEASYLGYEIPSALFTAAGVTLEKKHLVSAGSYEGAVVMLMHQDVFAAVMPGPLAHRWAESNRLAIVAESEPLPVGSIQAQDGLAPTQVASCRKALLSLQREGRLDWRMQIFPAWVEGFRAP